MNHLDLFSGIGGFKLAAQWAGYNTIGFSEIEPYASKILAQHWPHIQNYGDITQIDPNQIIEDHGTIELITGGFPCQPFSVAGKQRGAKDDRHLWPAMFKLISQLKPSWVLGENVAGIVDMELENCLTDLEREGYEVQPIIIPACAVDAKHRRDRVWILGYSQHTRRNGSQNRESTQERSNRDTTGQIQTVQPKRSSYSRQGYAETMANTSSIGQQGQRVHGRPLKTEEDKTRQTSRTNNISQNNPSIWLPEPTVGRVANGIPHRTHRLKGLGNAIVPQVAYEILKLMR